MKRIREVVFLAGKSSYEENIDMWVEFSDDLYLQRMG